MDDQTTAARSLDQARRRVESALPFSPEWDAAMEALEELESLGQLSAFERRRTSDSTEAGRRSGPN